MGKKKESLKIDSDEYVLRSDLEGRLKRGGAEAVKVFEERRAHHDEAYNQYVQDDLDDVFGRLGTGLDKHVNAYDAHLKKKLGGEYHKKHRVSFRALKDENLSGKIDHDMADKIAYDMAREIALNAIEMAGDDREMYEHDAERLNLRVGKDLAQAGINDLSQFAEAIKDSNLTFKQAMSGKGDPENDKFAAAVQTLGIPYSAALKNRATYDATVTDFTRKPEQYGGVFLPYMQEHVLGPLGVKLSDQTPFTEALKYHQQSAGDNFMPKTTDTYIEPAKK